MEPVVANDSGVLTERKKYRKVILTGTVIEVYEMDEKPYQLFEHYERKDKPDWLEAWEEELSLRTLDEQMENIKTFIGRQEFLQRHNGRISANITRTRNMVRRLSLANFDSGSKFITFTFADNITDVQQANAFWKTFIQRLRYRYGKFKYMSVLEFQKRGAVHYHCITDLPYVKKSDLADIWGNGFIKINRIEHVDNVGAYIVKYMTKDLFDERFVSLKSYQCSKGLDRPVSLREGQAEEIIAFYNLDAKKTVYESSYTSEHHGKIHYKEYNLKRL